MGVWCLGVLACGVAPTYGLLLAARAVVGVGEASFVALAAPFIGRCRPKSYLAGWRRGKEVPRMKPCAPPSPVLHAGELSRCDPLPSSRR